MMYRTYRIRAVTISIPSPDPDFGWDLPNDTGRREISHYAISYVGKLIDTALTQERAKALIDEWLDQRRTPTLDKCS